MAKRWSRGPSCDDVSATSVRPERETSEAVYSNFDHVLEAGVEAELLADSTLYAQHAAWDFCGYVWHAAGVWHNEVWRWNSPVEVLTDESCAAVIAQANDKWGSA